MFLDDFIYNTCLNVDKYDLNAVKAATEVIVREISKRVNAELGEKNTLGNTIAVFQRINKQWKLAVDRLEKVDKNILERNGFKDYLAPALTSHKAILEKLD